ncbi:hypothetical protein BFS13_03970 [Pantoea sp. Ae16]|nr:hypothetical protein BFS13_03970 [Pantoea sp. Ae16]
MERLTILQCGVNQSALKVIPKSMCVIEDADNGISQFNLCYLAIRQVAIHKIFTLSLYGFTHF